VWTQKFRNEHPEGLMMKVLLVCIVLSLLSRGLGAAEDLRNAAGLAFPSVQEGGSARAIAMGSTYVGVDEGSASLLWNPAGLGTLLYPELSLHHSSALLGAFRETAVLGLPMGYGNGFGLSLNYEDNGAFDGRDASGAESSGYAARAYGGSLGWGIGGPAGIFAGLALKMNHQDLAGSPGDAIAGDFGILWNIHPQLSLGAAYTNLGPEVHGYLLDQGLRVGLSYYIENGDNHEWLVAVSEESITHGDSSLHFGVEHTLYKLLALRGGYAFGLGDTVQQGLLGWTFGGGILIRSFRVDYAYVPLGELGATQRISLTYVFGQDARAVEKTTGRKLLPASLYGKSYLVKQGDSLWTISAKNKVLGDSFLWPLLFKSNGDQLSNPDQIKANEHLRFKKKYSQSEMNKATKKAEDTPAFVPNAEEAQ
jgi:hypothetical protein